MVKKQLEELKESMEATIKQVREQSRNEIMRI